MITCCGVHKWLEEFKAGLYDPLKHPNVYIFANMNLHFSCFLFIEDLAWLPIFYHVGKLLHLFILSYYLPGSGLKPKSHLCFLFPLIPFLQSIRMNCVFKLQNTPKSYSYLLSSLTLIDYPISSGLLQWSRCFHSYSCVSILNPAAREIFRKLHFYVKVFQFILTLRMETLY